jgi:hypothetical protein
MVEKEGTIEGPDHTNYLNFEEEEDSFHHFRMVEKEKENTVARNSVGSHSMVVKEGTIKGPDRTDYLNLEEEEEEDSFQHFRMTEKEQQNTVARNSVGPQSMVVKEGTTKGPDRTDYLNLYKEGCLIWGMFGHSNWWPGIVVKASSCNIRRKNKEYHGSSGLVITNSHS